MGRPSPTPPEPVRTAVAGGYPVWHGWRLLLEDLALHPANVLRRAQLPGDLFSRENASLDTPQYFRLWEALEAEAGDPGNPGEGVPLPLRMARAMTADWFEPALFAALCSADLNSALARIARYKRLVAPMALDVGVTPRGTTLALAWLDSTIPPPPVLVAFELVFFVQLARLATRSRVQPASLVCPTDLRPMPQYEAYFGCRLTFGPVPTLSFGAEDAQRPFLTANHGMWSFFEPGLRKRLHDLDRQATMSERVRSALLEALPAGDLAIDAIGRKLGVSSRTLQRRLQAEGVSFQQTLDQVRTSLARHYLTQSSLTGAEISFLLGFEDPNSFVRAFHGWTGTTPQTARSAG
jgi:AraC-like DNA-binding protein